MEERAVILTDGELHFLTDAMRVFGATRPRLQITPWIDCLREQSVTTQLMINGSGFERQRRCVAVQNQPSMCER